MSIFSENPVLVRELRGRLRLKRKGAGPASRWVAWTLGLVFAYFYGRGLIGIVRAPERDAREFWPLMSYGALVLIVLLAPALAATAITQEREQQTWETLATTQLSASDVLLGKWIGRQLIPWLVLAFALPFLLVCAVHGGMGFWILPAALLFFLVTIGFYSVLGLLCSFLTKRTAGATATALTLTALLCVGTVIVNGVIQMLFSGGGVPRNSPVMWFNPFFALSSLTSWLDQADNNSFGTNADSQLAPITVTCYLLVSLSASYAALRFMMLRYRRAVQG